MVPPFNLYQPDSLTSACSLLASYAGNARILAGGSELILLLKLGLMRARHVIDLKKIPLLDRLEFDPSARLLHVGALVTHRAIEKSELVREHFPVLGQMERQLANVRVRNVGTLAGNLCFAEPRADPGTLLLAFGARIKACSTRGERTVEMSQFFVDYYQTALEPDEVLTEIEIPKLAANSSATYLRFCPAERPTVAVALIMSWNGEGCTGVRLVLGCVGPRPLQAVDVEDRLRGKSADEIGAKTLEASELAARLSDPLDDIWGSAEYKRQVVKALVSRALMLLCEGRIGHGSIAASY